MDCKRDRGEVVVKRNSVSDSRHVKFSPRVKILNKEFRGGCKSCSEILLTGIEDPSNRSLCPSDTVPSSSSKASSCEDIVRLDSQLLPNPVRENATPQSKTGGSNKVEEFAKECQESTSKLSGADNTCVVEHMSPIPSPPVRIVECPEGYDPNSPAFIIDGRSPMMDDNPTPEDLLFSIHVRNSSSSSDDANSIGNKSRELPKSGQSFRSEDLHKTGESSKSGEAYKCREIHETKESRSMENLMAHDSRKSGDLGRLGKILLTTEEAEPNKNLDMEKTMSVDVKSGEKEILVYTSIRDSKDTSSKRKSDGTVALPK